MKSHCTWFFSTFAVTFALHLFKIGSTFELIHSLCLGTLHCFLGRIKDCRNPFCLSLKRFLKFNDKKARFVLMVTERKETNGQRHEKERETENKKE